MEVGKILHPRFLKKITQFYILIGLNTQNNFMVLHELISPNSEHKKKGAKTSRVKINCVYKKAPVARPNYIVKYSCINYYSQNEITI